MKGVSTAIAGEMAGASAIAKGAGASAGGAFGSDFKRLVSNQLSSIPVIGKTLGSNLGATFAGAFGVAAAIGIGVGLFQLGSQFDQAFDKIQQGTGATGTRLGKLKDDFRAVYAEVPQGMGTVADAITGLNQHLGLTGEPLQKLSIQILDLTRMTGTDLKTNITDVSRVFGDWGIKVNEQGGALDKMFHATQVTGVGFNDLAQQVVFFGAPLRELGFSFDESVALMSKWHQEGVNVETVLGGMRQSMGRLADPTTQVLDKIKEFPGLFDKFMAAPDIASRFTVIKDQILQLMSSGDPADKLKATSLALQVFGRRAGADIVAAFAEGRFDIGKILDEIKNKSKGAIESARSKTDDWGESWERVKHKMQLALEPLASRVFEGASSALESLEGPLSSVTKYMKDNKWAGTALAGVIGGIFVLALIAATVALISFAVAQLAAAAIPLAIIAGIALLVAIIVLLYTKWDEIWSAIADNPYIAAIIGIVLSILTFGLLPLIVGIVAIAVYWEEIWGVIYAVVSTAADIITTIIDALVSFVTAIWDAWGDDIMEVVSAAWNYVWTVISGVIAIITGIVKFFAALFTGNWTALWNAVKEIASAVWQILLAGWQFFLSLLQLVLEVAWAAIQALWQAGWALFLAIVSFVWEVIQTAISTALSFIVAIITAGVNFVIGFWQAAWDLVLSLLSAAWNAIQSAVSAGISAVVGFLSGLPGQALGVLEALVGLLLDLGSRAMNAMKDGLVAAWGAVTGWLGGVAAAAVGAVGDLSTKLVDAGKALINGFLDGVKSAWEKAKDFLSSLNPANYKGPPARDRKMLYAAGKLVMGGFQRGLATGWADVAQQLESYSVGVGGALIPNKAQVRALSNMPVVGGQLPTLEPLGGDHYELNVLGDVYDGDKFEDRVGGLFEVRAEKRDKGTVESARRKRRSVS